MNDGKRELKPLRKQDLFCLRRQHTNTTYNTFKQTKTIYIHIFMYVYTYIYIYITFLLCTTLRQGSPLDSSYRDVFSFRLYLQKLGVTRPSSRGKKLGKVSVGICKTSLGPARCSAGSKRRRREKVLSPHLLAKKFPGRIFIRTLY